MKALALASALLAQVPASGTSRNTLKALAVVWA